MDERHRVLGDLLVRGLDGRRALLPRRAEGQCVNGISRERKRRKLQNEIIIVSGLPRSGTSLMMQMLDNGGVPVVTDNIRTPDTDNPRGYYEFEQVKKIKEDVSWLPATRGKAFKMVSQLLYELPASETYRVIFMERDLDEMIRSQEKMLSRLGKPTAPKRGDQAAFHPAPRKAASVAGRAEQLQTAVCSIQGRCGEPLSGGVAIERVPSGEDRHGGHGENG